MTEETPQSAPAAAALPDDPSLEWLRKEAKRRLAELRRLNPTARLAQAQWAIAKEYGFPSWRALKRHVESLTVEGRLVDAARAGDVARLAELLDAHPEKLHMRTEPYEWTLLHVAAERGRLAAVELLLARGLDVNARESGDHTYAMHWAAAGGHLAVVRRLTDAGGDVLGRGDDHELEVIGWATCSPGGDYEAKFAVTDFLVSRGARHHIFSAIALNLDGEVRRIVAADPTALSRRMSRHENGQLPLHFAVRMNRPEMVSLLLELGADPAATDAYGLPASVYAASTDVGDTVIETLTGHGAMGLFGALALGDERLAERLLADYGRPDVGVLHLMAKRGNARAVRWLLEHGADPNARWNHWDAEVTPLHLAAAQGHTDVVRLLLEAGADPTIRDSKHGGDAKGWAASGLVQPAPASSEIIAMLEAHEMR